MSHRILPMPVAPPPSGSPEFGRLRVRVLEAVVLGGTAEVPQALAGALEAWAIELAGSGGGPARGVDHASVPEAWRAPLSWAGVPLAAGGELRWGVDLAEDAALREPEIVTAGVRLPPPARLTALTSLALKPLRLFVGERLGFRLQAGSGLHIALWPRLAVLVSSAEVTLGGFFHGPEHGQRSALSVGPGEFQVVRW